MFKNFQNLYSSNILSFIGYVYILYYAFFYFISFPQRIEDLANKEYMSYLLSIETSTMFIGTFIFSILTILSFILICATEFFLQKKNIIPIFQFSEYKFHRYIFILGLLFQAIPLIFLIL